jgi:hypothetical protein
MSLLIEGAERGGQIQDLVINSVGWRRHLPDQIVRSHPPQPSVPVLRSML